MKVQQTPNLKLNNQRQNDSQRSSSNIAFKGAGDVAAQFLRFLDTNQAWGANFVDVAFMVTPRTAVDFTRGPDAGFETMRREASGTVNHSLVGAYGLGAAFLLAQSLNKDFGIKSHNMFVNDETIDAFGHVWHEQFRANDKNSIKTLPKFLSKVVNGLQGFNPEVNKVNGWVPLKLEEGSKTKANIIKALKDMVEISTEQPTRRRSIAAKKLINRKKAYIKSLIASELGAEKNYRFVNGDKKITSSLDEMLNSIYKLSKSFMSDKVGTEFAQKSSVLENSFLQRLKGLNKKTSIIGIGIAALIGCNIQPLNMYLTKKKTGKSGFVGGGDPDHSNKFKIMKAAAAGIFGVMVLKNINAKNGAELLKKIQFKGFTPTLDQFKMVYGMTIMSRFVVARNKNELRESATKDTLGFINWMILGSFVSKATALAFEKFGNLKNSTFLRYNETEHGKGWFKKLTKSDLITRDEVLINALKEAGISTVEKGKALPYKELIKKAAENVEKSAALKEALKKVKLLNAAQLAGYLYSGLVLGMGIPKLNIAITKSLEKKQQAKNEALKNNPSNIAFLSNKVQNEKAFVKFSGVK